MSEKKTVWLTIDKEDANILNKALTMYFISQRRPILGMKKKDLDYGLRITELGSVIGGIIDDWDKEASTTTAPTGNGE
jgi:hypothetical protein